MKDKIRNTKPPQKTISNEIHEGTGEMLRSFMGPVSPLLSFVWPSFHQKEVERWRNDVHNELIRLGETQDEYKIENLLNNSEFISILIQATQIASRNFQDEKLRHLKNIVLNTPITPPSPDIKLIFLNFIDELSVIQIKILSILNNRNTEIESIKSYPELFDFLTRICGLNISRHEFRMYLLGLVNKGLLRLSNDFDDFEDEIYTSHGMAIEDGKEKLNIYILVLNTGKSLLEFISEHAATN